MQWWWWRGKKLCDSVGVDERLERHVVTKRNGSERKKNWWWMKMIEDEDDRRRQRTTQGRGIGSENVSEYDDDDGDGNACVVECR